MSHTAHIPSHRKPRQRASKSALRAGVAGGVLSTIAVAGAAGPAQAEPVTQTIEMPTITSGFSTAVAASAQATQQVALDLETQADEDAAAEKAAKTAKKAHAEAVRKAEAKKKAEAAAKAKAEAEAEERAERASRTSERTTLSASSGSSGSSDSGSSASAPSSSNVSGSAASIVAFAKAQVGDAYVSGGTGPNAWDCSGLTQAAYRTAGIDLPRVSQSQSTFGTQVSLDNLQPGDILYWGSAGSAYHVAIYIGGGEFVGAQNSSTGTVQRSMDYDRPTGAVRVL
ncbi:C40 family peptidase [Streptomyces griseus]|uniref:NLP/P60-family protein n=1 Tax=Streptomyces griseus subsp. griseus (strain JCM 4626 / CBS 651.72 / NBRC 13350 / KCC S-0626 / ISP 5235) TaxID=455632 RepID=B1W520_STRGG|nr:MULTISPECIES: C40 family peptidase [Streptomyces]MYR12038.1 glycoside hydrolase [Streptomyces sp. SID724]MYR50597.1 glycoside hydrolase [Streptomyces sp. SID4928]EGE42552.1 NLP/P60 protein [Streptomyces sp. ACT-1]MBW3705456.1 NlpC/P60 family protein [Streptomyces griseus]MYR14862.1 glycoside hydrolase [Streptomyces sp. SID724]